ncbi:MAG TPA: carboxypeptidase-like regulatory domain-containing protein, partial [Blastocatellia bacterium]
MTFLRSSLRRGVLIAPVVILVMSALIHAQDYRGKVQGVVTDASGAALAGVNVTLRNVGTGVEVTRQTNSEGRYIFDFVESGVYSVLVEATGFKKYEQRNVTVQNRGDVTVDAKLEIGGVTEVITVQDSPVAVKFNSTSDILTIG